MLKFSYLDPNTYVQNQVATIEGAGGDLNGYSVRVKGFNDKRGQFKCKVLGINGEYDMVVWLYPDQLVSNRAPQIGEETESIEPAEDEGWMEYLQGLDSGTVSPPRYSFIEHNGHVLVGDTKNWYHVDEYEGGYNPTELEKVYHPYEIEYYINNGFWNKVDDKIAKQATIKASQERDLTTIIRWKPADIQIQGILLNENPEYYTVYVQVDDPTDLDMLDHKTFKQAALTDALRGDFEDAGSYMYIAHVPIQVASKEETEIPLDSYVQMLKNEVSGMTLADIKEKVTNKIAETFGAITVPGPDYVFYGISYEGENARMDASDKQIIENYIGEALKNNGQLPEGAKVSYVGDVWPSIIRSEEDEHPRTGKPIYHTSISKEIAPDYVIVYPDGTQSDTIQFSIHIKDAKMFETPYYPGSFDSPPEGGEIEINFKIESMEI